MMAAKIRCGVEPDKLNCQTMLFILNPINCYETAFSTAYFFFSVCKTDNKVFVCKSKTSVAYHVKKECREIKSCTHEVIEITFKGAVNE
jgi:hypothetical protein